jgi:hypothetical protein
MDIPIDLERLLQDVLVSINEDTVRISDNDLPGRNCPAICKLT